MQRTDSIPRKRRDRFYWVTPDALRRVTAVIHSRLQRANQRDLLARHALGCTVREMASNPDVYGENAVRQLAEFTGIAGGPAALLEMARFSAEYTKAVIIEQGRIPMANGGFVTYSHFRQLMRIRKKSNQLAYLNWARRRGLTAVQLGRTITAAFKKARDTH